MIRKGITVAVPFDGRMLPPDWGWTFAQLRWPMNCDLHYERLLDTEIGEARCQLAENAKLRGSRWIYFQDQDVVPPLNAVKLLIQAMDERPDVAVISGVYTDKEDPPHPMVFNEAGAGPFWDWTIGEVFKVAFGVPMGCTLINVPLLDRIPQPWFRTVDEPHERWTEDIWFCKQAREAGLSIYAHGGVLCRHFDLKTGRSYFLPAGSKPYRRFCGQDKESSYATCYS